MCIRWKDHMENMAKILLARHIHLSLMKSLTLIHPLDVTRTNLFLQYKSL